MNRHDYDSWRSNKDSLSIIFLNWGKNYFSIERIIRRELSAELTVLFVHSTFNAIFRKQDDLLA